MVREKDKQLAQLQKNRTELQPEQLMSSLKQVLSEERHKANKEMRSFLSSFQQESQATAARLADLSPSYRAELEEQKQQAKR